MGYIITLDTINGEQYIALGEIGLTMHANQAAINIKFKENAFQKTSLLALMEAKLTHEIFLFAKTSSEENAMEIEKESNLA